MTVQEAKDYLQNGCPHNPWNDDVCGKCAKEVKKLWLHEANDPNDNAEFRRWLDGDDQGS